jgi:hypothetical protein
MKALVLAALPAAASCRAVEPAQDAGLPAARARIG